MKSVTLPTAIPGPSMKLWPPVPMIKMVLGTSILFGVIYLAMKGGKRVSNATETLIGRTKSSVDSVSEGL